MSGSDKKQSSSRPCGKGDRGSGGGGNDQEDEIDGPVERRCPEEESGHSCKRGGKGVSLFRFSSAKKKLLLLQRRRRRRRKGILVSSRSSGRWDGGAGVGCCSCMKQPMTLDSSAESPTSDPNSTEFTHDMLRVFIEKNDFYARECNPHLDDK